jgi:hypothetical protein
MVYQRPLFAALSQRSAAQRSVLQVCTGPRRVGQRTGASQSMREDAWTHHDVNAEKALVSPHKWLPEQGHQAPMSCSSAPHIQTHGRLARRFRALGRSAIQYTTLSRAAMLLSWHWGRSSFISSHQSISVLAGRQPHLVV